MGHMATTVPGPRTSAYERIPSYALPPGSAPQTRCSVTEMPNVGPLIEDEPGAEARCSISNVSESSTTSASATHGFKIDVPRVSVDDAWGVAPWAPLRFDLNHTLSPGLSRRCAFTARSTAVLAA